MTQYNQNQYQQYQQQQQQQQQHKAISATDPHFIENYYKSSRLHHLSLWRSKFQEQLDAYLAEMVESNRKQKKKRGHSVTMATEQQPLSVSSNNNNNEEEDSEGSILASKLIHQLDSNELESMSSTVVAAAGRQGQISKHDVGNEGNDNNDYDEYGANEDEAEEEEGRQEGAEEEEDMTIAGHHGGGEGQQQHVGVGTKVINIKGVGGDDPTVAQRYIMHVDMVGGLFSSML